MHRLFGPVSLLILASALAVGAEPPPCPPMSAPGCYAEEARPVNRTILNACLTETRCVTEVTEQKGYTVKFKDVPTEVPYTRLVPVCVTDPHTGLERTEMRPETVMQKATTTYIVVLPPDCPVTTKKKEERKKLRLEIKIGHRPEVVEEKVPLPCCGKGCP